MHLRQAAYTQTRKEKEKEKEELDITIAKPTNVLNFLITVTKPCA